MRTLLHHPARARNGPAPAPRRRPTPAERWPEGRWGPVQPALYRNHQVYICRDRPSPATCGWLRLPRWRRRRRVQVPVAAVHARVRPAGRPPRARRWFAQLDAMILHETTWRMRPPRGSRAGGFLRV